jgi:hypothetical protein
VVARIGGKALDVNGVKQLAKHPFQGSVVGAVAGLDAVPDFAYGRVLAALAATKKAKAVAA